MNLSDLEASLDDNPDDTLVRLAYADALEMDGQVKQAEFQRLLVRHHVWPQKDGHLLESERGQWRFFANTCRQRPCYLGFLCMEEQAHTLPHLPSLHAENPRKDLEQKLLKLFDEKGLFSVNREKQIQEWASLGQYAKVDNKEQE